MYSSLNSRYIVKLINNLISFIMYLSKKNSLLLSKVGFFLLLLKTRTCKYTDNNTLLSVGFNFEGNDYIGKSCLRYNIRALRVDCLKGTTLDL